MGLTDLVRPAILAYFLTNLCTERGLIPISLFFFRAPSCLTKRQGSKSLRFFKYFFNHSFALLDKKTTRHLLPLPFTANSFLSRFISSFLRLQASETRRPVENKSSNIDLSLNVIISF